MGKMLRRAVCAITSLIVAGISLPAYAGDIEGAALSKQPIPSPPTQEAQQTSGQSLEPSRLQLIKSMVDQTIKQQGVPGYAIAIVKDGKVVFQQTLGKADLENNKAVTVDTIFGLASVTKTFTAMALLHLVDQGQVKTTDTLDKYLTDIPPAWRQLTIEQLATMRAGIPASRAKEYPWPQEKKWVEQQALVSQPGTQFLYSNASYRILGDVIEKVTGSSYMDYISKLILVPLGMNDTGTTVSMAATGRVSCQYADNLGPARAIPPKEPMASYSAGMLASSLKDMCTYAQAILDKKILSPNGYKIYMDVRNPLPSGDAANWAYGWGSNYNKRLGMLMVNMNGSLLGVASQIILVPEQNLAMVALSNLRKKAVYGVGRRALGIYLTGRDLENDLFQRAVLNQNQENLDHDKASTGDGL